MKAYISDINEEELLRKREEYWNTRVEGDPEIWQTLKSCCSDDMTEGNILFIFLLFDVLCVNIIIYR